MFVSEVERCQSKKQNELSDDVYGENQHQSCEEIYHVDDADLMRLPAAQRQLFLRIKKNQRQNDDAEGKADGPNIAGNTGGHVVSKRYSIGF
jgi:hypothetical protein